MPQLHLYVSESTARQLRRKAAEKKLSVSRYLAQLAGEDGAAGWPRGFFEQVAGGWRGGSLQRAPQGELEIRKGW